MAASRRVDEGTALARIAFAGLGAMGLPMAVRLLQAGFAVAGFDVLPEARARFAALGGRASPSLAEAVRGASILITMLPDGAVVRMAVLGVMGALELGALVIDMGSSDPIGTRALGADLAVRGLALIDAPVSGGVARAADGTLAIMVGGIAEIVTRAWPVLEALGRSPLRTGPLGSGHALQALNTYVSGAGLAAAVEALQVGTAFGLDPASMVDVLDAAAGWTITTKTTLKQFALSGLVDSGASAALVAKDIRTAASLADALAIEAPLAQRCAALWDAAAAKLGAAPDPPEYDQPASLGG